MELFNSIFSNASITVPLIALFASMILNLPDKLEKSQRIHRVLLSFTVIPIVIYIIFFSIGSAFGLIYHHPELFDTKERISHFILNVPHYFILLFVYLIYSLIKITRKSFVMFISLAIFLHAIGSLYMAAIQEL